MIHRKNAQFVAYLGTAYNIQGRDGVGADDTVFLIEYDAGTEADKNSAAIAENSAAIDNLIVTMLEAIKMFLKFFAGNFFCKSKRFLKKFLEV